MERAVEHRASAPASPREIEMTGGKTVADMSVRRNGVGTRAVRNRTLRPNETGTMP